MQYISATKAQNNFGTLVDMALEEPVTIQRSGRNAVVMMSHQEYAKLEAIIKKYMMSMGKH